MLKNDVLGKDYRGETAVNRIMTTKEQSRTSWEERRKEGKEIHVGNA